MEGSGLAEAPASAFGALPAFSAFGIELEYMIVDRASLDVRPTADRVLQRLHDEVRGNRPGPGGPVVSEVTRGELGWSNELVLHLLELKNPKPTADLARLAAGFQREIVTVQRTLHEFGARLMPGGMHPWMDPSAETVLWPHAGHAIYAAYDRIFDCRRHGWANVQAMHVNLPFAGDDEFARRHAAVRALLPLVPALAASSPYADGRAAGVLDYRLEVYRTHASRVPELTGDVVPDNQASRAQYEATLLAPLYDAIARHDPHATLRHEWLNARGAIARFERNAIEIRVADVQEHPGVDVALAALFVDAAQWLVRTRPLAALQALDTGRLAGVLLECARHAERATIDHTPLLRVFGTTASHCTAGALWRVLAEQLAAGGARHVALWRPVLQRILAHGPLARRLLAAGGLRPDRATLARVYAQLCDCLEHGRAFLP